MELSPYACETCQGVGTIDLTLGGEWNSNPASECPDCNGTGERTRTNSDGWINASEFLPSLGVPVLVLLKDVVHVGALHVDMPVYGASTEKFWFLELPDPEDRGIELSQITHWMEIPKRIANPINNRVEQFEAVSNIVRTSRDENGNGGYLVAEVSHMRMDSRELAVLFEQAPNLLNELKMIADWLEESGFSSDRQRAAIARATRKHS